MNPVQFIPHLRMEDETKVIFLYTTRQIFRKLSENLQDKTYSWKFIRKSETQNREFRKV